ncbi:MAG: peptide deformylase [Patescibacteria group bacterium]|nr:peptide deformylase [Patescibacteria group bacterium]
MVIKDLPQIGSEILRKECAPVQLKEIKTRRIEQIISDLCDSIEEAKLIGMSAPQLGHSLNIIITELRELPHRKVQDIDPLRVYINPIIKNLSKEEEIIYEGCGSVMNGKLFGPVKRPISIEVEALDKNGKKFNMKASGLLARVIQHECDHLKGILFIDKVTDNTKLLSRNNYIKLMKEGKIK